VRKGDACGDRHECRSLADYMPLVRSMVERYGYRTVFLATPDPTVLTEVDRFAPAALEHGVTFKFVPTTNTTAEIKARGFKKIDDAIQQGALDVADEFEASMVSSYLLAETHGFLGGFSSTAARLAYSLMAAGPSGCLKPYHSVDINWCAAFGKGGPEVIRRDNASCDHFKWEGGMPELPCSISC